MRGSNVKCEIERDPELWSVDADKGQIAQVVNNLIINADQAMPRGGRINLRMTNEQLRFGQVPTLQAGDYVAIEVRDTGAGIPPEAISRIFDPYYTTKDNGNGLGLASSSTIVQGHGGTITVDSKLNEGTTFTVYLPRSRYQAAPESPTPEPPEAAQVDAPAPTTAGKRILVMDDMEDMMLVAGEILKVLGYEVTCTADGSEAIKAYKEAKEAGQPFDAVVFDLTVPGGMGGEEAGQILQEYDPALRAIASSGYTTSNIMSDFRDSPFQAVVPKPYRIGEMRDALLRVLT